MDSELSNYEYLWASGNWCLVRSDSEDGQFIIFDEAHSSILSLTDDCLHHRLVAAMQEHGVVVRDDMPSREVSIDDFVIEN